MIPLYSASMSTPSSPDSDIATERYRGPSAVVAGLGEGALQTKFMMLAGLAAGAASAIIFPTKTGQIVQKIEDGVASASASSHPLKKFAGKIFGFAVDLGKEATDLIMSIGFIKKGLKNIDPNRVRTTIDAAIITSAGASIAGSVLGGGKGIHDAIEGRKQFERAQSEVVSLRAEKDVMAAMIAQQELATTPPNTAPRPQVSTIQLDGKIQQHGTEQQL
jgi:hypothetical protein